MVAHPEESLEARLRRGGLVLADRQGRSVHASLISIVQEGDRVGRARTQQGQERSVGWQRVTGRENATGGRRAIWARTVGGRCVAGQGCVPVSLPPQLELRRSRSALYRTEREIATSRGLRQVHCRPAGVTGPLQLLVVKIAGGRPSPPEPRARASQETGRLRPPPTLYAQAQPEWIAGVPLSRTASRRSPPLPSRPARAAHRRASSRRSGGRGALTLAPGLNVTQRREAEAR